jgi:hypothetical protein
MGSRIYIIVQEDCFITCPGLLPDRVRNTHSVQNTPEGVVKTHGIQNTPEGDVRMCYTGMPLPSAQCKKHLRLSKQLKR